MSKWCLFTAYDESFAAVAKLTLPAMRQWAARHGMDFRKFVSPTPYPTAWSKLYRARNLFNKGYEFVFWIDADAAIRRFDEDIRDHIDTEHHLFFSFESYPEISPLRLNSGVFVWRNSPETHRFIEATLAQKRFLHHKWWDQAAMIAALGLWSHFDDEHHRQDAPTDLFCLVKRLPDRWNCPMGREAMPDAIVRHFIAMTPSGKRLGIAIDALLGHRDEAQELAFKNFIREQLWPLTMRECHREGSSSDRGFTLQIFRALLGRKRASHRHSVGEPL